MIAWLQKQFPPKHEVKNAYTMEEVQTYFEVRREWMESTFVGWLLDNVYYPTYRFFKNRRWRDVKYWLKPSNVIKVEKHTRWCEYNKPILVFHANFQILNDFYKEEGECLAKYIKTEWTEEELVAEENQMGREWAETQMAAYKTLKELHEWYNSHTADQISDLLDGYPADYDWKGWRGNDKNTHPTYSEELAKETNNRLTQLISLREYLWT